MRDQDVLMVFFVLFCFVVSFLLVPLFLPSDLTFLFLIFPSPDYFSILIFPSFDFDFKIDFLARVGTPGSIFWTVISPAERVMLVFSDFQHFFFAGFFHCFCFPCF